MGNQQMRHNIRWWQLGLIGACLSAVLLLSALAWELHVKVSLPHPDGKFAVGRHVRWLYREGQAKAMLWSWYPVDLGVKGRKSSYLPAAGSHSSSPPRARGWVTMFDRSPDLIETDSLDDVPISQQRTSFPVIVLRAGLAAPMSSYAALAQMLASRGYIVVGEDVPGLTRRMALPDGHVVERSAGTDPEALPASEANAVIEALQNRWIAQTASLLEQVRSINRDATAPWFGRMHMDRVIAVGHSLGGSSLSAFCQAHDECSLVVDLDGALHGTALTQPLHAPTLFVVGEHGAEDARDSARIMAGITHQVAGLPPGQGEIIHLRGASHFGFTDQMYVKSAIGLRLLRWCGVIGMDPEQQLRSTVDIIENAVVRDGR